MSTPLAQLQIVHLRHPLTDPIQTTMGPMVARPALLLRIEDLDGAEGWGEIWCNFPPGGDIYRAGLALNVLPAVLAGMTGDTPQPAAYVQQRLHRLTLQAGEAGPVAQLAAGVDIALHDLAARRGGLPLAVYLGGDVRAVPAYASGISPQHHEAQMDRMRASGYRYFKQRIGFGQDDGLPELRDSAASLAPAERLMADANQAWTLDTALERLRQLDALALDWLEEPLPADAPDHEWRTLAVASNTPLAGGENLRHPDHFSAAVQGRTLSVIQPDICKWGGLSGCHAVAREAIQQGLRYCPHYLGGGVGLIASAHLLSAVGGDGQLEVDSSDNPLQAALAGGSIVLSEGSFPLALGPGLGYQPDVGAVSDLVVSDTTVACAP